MTSLTDRSSSLTLARGFLNHRFYVAKDGLLVSF